MYQFDKEHAFGFAGHINAQTKVHNNELVFTYCPYCKPKNDKNTFSINLSTGQFKCLRAKCGISGNMVTLAKDFDFSLGTQFDEYYNQKKQYRQLNTPKEPIQPKNKAVEYLQGRGISEDVAKLYEITVHKSNENILVFPFYDEKGELQFIKYRKTDFDKSKDKNKEWCESNCKPILFGMKQCNLENKTLILTEGQLDSLSVATAEIENACSVPTGAKGFTWVPYCYDWIISNFEVLIVFGDYENGNISLLAELSRRFQKKLMIKHVRKEDYKDCKDANDILRKYGAEQVKKCIENAVLLPIKRIKKLSEVEDVDIFKLKKMKTGIYQLDKLFYGGLPFGGVALITGKSGEGKSTLANQIIINAIQQKFKCMVYSGELPNYLFKSWLNFQIAGRNHISETQNQWGEPQYNISTMNKKLIADWYDEELYIYSSDIVEDDEKDDLCGLLQDVINQYGVKVVLIDNLMTAIDLDADKNTDKYEHQSIFIKKLQRIAAANNALIILVAHKRKNGMSSYEADEISGSSDIQNLATVTISYGRDKDISESQRMCKVLKNRLFGKVDMKGFTLDFDAKSKRIYGDGDNLNKEYDWVRFIENYTQTSFEEVTTNPSDKLPF